MRAILHNGQLVAFAHGPRIKLDPDLDALAADHPDRRWAMALATFACLTETGDQPGPYMSDYAAQFARDILLPLPEFVLYTRLDRRRPRHVLQGADRAGPPPPLRAELGRN